MVFRSMPAKHTLHVVFAETCLNAVRDSLHKPMQQDDMLNLATNAGCRVDPHG